MPLLCDDQQAPCVFYHGTRRPFDHFKPNAIGLIHFSSSRRQAEEFAQEARGDRRLPVGEARVISVHLKAGRVFDCADTQALAALADTLDWDLVIEQAEELSQLPWTREEARAWLNRGEWQILELPCVLEQLRQRADAVVMQELGVRNIAVLSPDQVHILRADPVETIQARRKLGP